MGLFKKKQEKKSDFDKISSISIKIKVFKELGSGVRVCKAEYMATEKKNEFGELVSLNAKTKHDEYVDFQMDSIYREMQILLNLRGKNKKERQDILSKRIRKQERLIFFLERVPELNALYNYQDEYGRLRDYRVLKNYMNLDTDGAYFYIDEGIRVYEFDAIDGFLIPRWHGSDTYSSFPDHTRVKKIKIQTDFKFLKDLAGYRLQDKLINYGTIFFIILMCILGIEAFAGYKLYTMHSEATYNKAEQFCMDSSTELNKKYRELISDSIDFQKYIIEQNKENLTQNTENNIKDLTPNT